MNPGSKPALQNKAYVERDSINYAADPLVQYMSKTDLDKLIEKTRKEMEAAAKELDFLEAARLRDEMYGLMKLREGKK